MEADVDVRVVQREDLEPGTFVDSDHLAAALRAVGPGAERHDEAFHA